MQQKPHGFTSMNRIYAVVFSGKADQVVGHPITKLAACVKYPAPKGTGLEIGEAILRWIVRYP